MSKRQPCIECRVLPKWGARHRCRICYFRHQPIGERIEESRRRLAMVPVDLRRDRVSKKSWPEGERWCSGCQSFVPLIDCQGSRCKPCASAASHGAMIEKTYGLTPEEYDRLLALQGGRCAICRNRPGKKRLAVDHHHQEGHVRGLLCGRCNHDLLGAGYDSPEKLLAGYHYLNTPPTSGRWVKPEDGLVAPLDPALAETPAAPLDDDLDPPERGHVKKVGPPPRAEEWTGPVLLPTVEGAKRLSTFEAMALKAYLDEDLKLAPF